MQNNLNRLSCLLKEWIKTAEDVQKTTTTHSSYLPLIVLAASSEDKDPWQLPIHSACHAADKPNTYI